jgi:hypothetical protein
MRPYLNSILLLFLTYTGTSFAQSIQLETKDATGATNGTITIGGGVDAYYAYDLNKPVDDIPYYVSSSRHNEFNVNMAYLDVNYTSARVKARFTPGIGTYMNANYVDEVGLLKMPLEASVGVKLLKNKALWLETGVLSSPYSSESAFSKDQWVYTRPFASEYVPYYLCGARLAYQVNDRLKLVAMLLNGWQQIKDKNEQKSLGTQVEYKPNDKNLFNWNVYVGDERSATNPNARMRYFTDFYWVYNSTGRFSYATNLYYGIQQMLIPVDNTTRYDPWWQANMTARYTLKNRMSFSGRVEYYHDPNNIQLSNITGNTGFECFGGALCFNIPVLDNAMLRFEAKQLMSMDKEIFNGSNGTPTKNATIFTSNLTVWF